MKIKLLLFNSFLFSCFLLSAQSYQLSVDTVEYVPLENSNLLTNGQLWDDEEILIPESFTFELFGEPTTLNVLDPNGLLSDEGFYAYTDFSGVIPFYADLVDLGFEDGISRSDISYLIEGNEGDRILKIEWTNVGFFDELYYNVDQSFVNFQLWIYESDGTIEIYYGDSEINNDIVFSYYGGGPLIGLLDNYSDNTYTADEFIVLVGDPSNPSVQLWEDEFDFEYTSLLELNPAPNTRYTFTPGLGVSVDQIKAQSNRFTIYPNPVSAELNLKASEDSIPIESVGIYNNDGRLMKTIYSNFSNINVADLVNGVYHLNILTEDGLAVKRFVKID